MRSRIIQRLDVGAPASNRSTSETFIANGTIALGDWVAFDTSKTGTDRELFVIKAGAVALGNSLVCGVALAAATAGQNVEVCVGGYCATAKCEASVSAANISLIIVAVAGSAEANVAANTTIPCGVSLAAVGAGVAPVWVYGIF